MCRIWSSESHSGTLGKTISWLLRTLEERRAKLEQEEKENVIILEDLKKSPQPITSDSVNSAGSANMEWLLVSTGSPVPTGARSVMEDRLWDNSSLASAVKMGA